MSETAAKQIENESDSFAECWKAAREEEPGRRFRKLRSLRRSETSTRPVWLTALVITVGVSCVGAGIFLTFFPGPNWLFLIPGCSLLAAEFGAVARLLDRTEKAAQPAIRKLSAAKDATPKPLWIAANLLFAAGILFATFTLLT